MKINTKFFKEIEINDNNIIQFTHGIPGFENLTGFVILEIEDQQYLKCLQSTENKDVCLLIASPWEYFAEYEVQIPDEDLEELNINSENDMNIYSVIRVNENNLTANLLAPIIININTNKGKQLILQNSKYTVRQEIIC